MDDGNRPLFHGQPKSQIPRKTQPTPSALSSLKVLYLKWLIKIILFLIKKIITVLLIPVIIVLLIVILIISLIVGVILMIIYMSPLSIFFPMPDTGTDDIRIVLSQYYQEFNQQISEYESDGKTITYQNSENRRWNTICIQIHKLIAQPLKKRGIVYRILS